MTRSVLLTIFFVWTTSALSGQKLVRGNVVELGTNKPIAFANIGIRKSIVGTISNADGTFFIRIPDSHLNDTVTFSALGYVEKSLPILSLDETKTVTIALTEKPILLQEITVSSRSKDRKSYELGNRYSNGGLNLSTAEEATAGASVALLIQNKWPSYRADLFYPFFLETAKLKVSDNTIGSFKIRVRLYKVDSLTGQPGDDMLNESIVIESDLRGGWLKFDLSEHHLQVKRPFFIAFEWIMEEKDRNALKQAYRNFEKLHPERVLDTMIIDGKDVAVRNYVDFVAGVSFGVSMLQFSRENYQTFSRLNSQGEWKQAPYILTARVTVSK